MAGELNIVPLDPHRADVAALIQQADDYLLSRYPPELCYLDDAAALARPGVTLLGAFLNSCLVAIGAVKIRRDDGHFGEIKRVFVTASARGKGVGRSLMGALEEVARARGIVLLRLETGVEQPEAVALYKSLGYRVRGPFAEYADEPMSIFMEKKLGDC